MLAVTAPLEDGDGRIESSIPTWLHSKTASQIKRIETRHETQLRETRSTWKNMGEICVCVGGGVILDTHEAEAQVSQI